MTYGFLGVFFPNPLKNFQHPAALSARGQLMSRSYAACVSEDESAPLSLQCFLPASCAWCDECIRRLLSHPRCLGFVAFSMGFCKSISLRAPRAAPSQSRQLTQPACSTAKIPAPCFIPVLGFDFISAFAGRSMAE